MKKIILLTTFLFALDVGAKTITENGVQYTCNPQSTCEEKLRAANKEISKLKSQISKLKNEGQKEVVRNIVLPIETVKMVVQEPSKNILSVELVRSQNGLTVNTSNNNTTVKSNIDTGLGLMYQRRFNDYYGGMGFDSNGSIKLNAGKGF